MNISTDDKIRIWKALACYINECNQLSQTDQELSDYYKDEAQKAIELARLFNQRK